MSKFLYYLNLVAHGQSSILLFRRLWDRVSASGRHMAQCLGCLLFSNQLQYTGLDIARTLNDCYYHLLPWTKLEKNFQIWTLKNGLIWSPMAITNSILQYLWQQTLACLVFAISNLHSIMSKLRDIFPSFKGKWKKVGIKTNSNQKLLHFPSALYDLLFGYSGNCTYSLIIPINI